MKCKSIVFFQLLFLGIASSLFSQETILLNNGHSITFFNQLPDSISQFYTSTDLVENLNNPGKNTFLDDFNIDATITINFNDSTGSLSVYVKIPNSSINEIDLNLVDNEYGPSIIDLIGLRKRMDIIFVWYRMVPYYSEDMNSDLKNLLREVPIDMICFLENNKGNVLTVQFTLNYYKNGAYVNPRINLRYPLFIDLNEVYPGVKYTNELYDYFIRSQYPVLVDNKISGEITTEGAIVLDFFGGEYSVSSD